MNWKRILRITNCYLVTTGFQLHSFEPITERFHVSVWALVNFIVLTLFYIICVNEHFAQSPLLKICYDVSPFLSKLIRIHLLLGLTVYIFRFFQMARIGRSCNCMSSLATKMCRRKFSISEAFAYFSFYSTFIISLCFAFYIAYEMQFKMPAWANIFISFGLFIPHFALAGALKLYMLNCWLMREELCSMKSELDDILIEQLPFEIKNVVSATNDRIKITEIDMQKLLEQQYIRFLQINDKLRLVNGTLEKELLLLLVMNSICLLAGVYMLVYFRTSWYIFFASSGKRIFYAENIAVYILIFWDYLCLSISVGLFNKVKSQILERIQLALVSKCIASSLHATLMEVRYLLIFQLRLRMFNVADVNAVNLIMVHIMVGIIISIVVIYHYFNDQIVSITEQIESIDFDD